MAAHTKTSGILPRVFQAFVGLLLGAAVWALPVGADQWPPASDEAHLGGKIAKEIEAHYRLVTHPGQVERITRVGSAVARVVERQDLTYHFKIVDIPGVNAVAIPGGWVYVTEGMMKFIRSDDELAAVLAHELTHINHRHYYIQEQRAQSMTPGLILAAALSVLAHSPAPLMGGQLAMQGAMSDYQRDLERDADLNGISYLIQTSYSSVAMLTLMEHLSSAERFSGLPTDFGIYQDHPSAAERVGYIRADLARRNIPIVRRIAESYLEITLEPEVPAEGQPVTILVDGVPVLTIGAAADGHSPIERARAAAARLDAFFNQDPAPYDVRTVSGRDRWVVVGNEGVLFEVTRQDATYARTTPQAVAEDLRARLAQVIGAAPYIRKF